MKTKSRRRRVARAWTRADLRELRMASRNRIPVDEISRKTKRTPGALRQKAFALGISIGHMPRL